LRPVRTRAGILGITHKVRERLPRKSGCAFTRLKQDIFWNKMTIVTGRGNSGKWF
jgi:hypothetical protein